MIIEVLASGRLDFKLDVLAVQALLVIPVTVMQIMCLSILIVSLLQKLPVVKQIVP